MITLHCGCKGPVPDATVARGRPVCNALSTLERQSSVATMLSRRREDTITASLSLGWLPRRRAFRKRDSHHKIGHPGRVCFQCGRPLMCIGRKTTGQWNTSGGRMKACAAFAVGLSPADRREQTQACCVLRVRRPTEIQQLDHLPGATVFRGSRAVAELRRAGIAGVLSRGVSGI